MSDIIQLLPDPVANQIAAGEVIQRPASVIKELVENALDAGASKITVNIKDAGKTLIQVIDDGCGMTENDARMSFERHATSKIKSADDLFAIKTMGFRGEALASIAAIAEVELKTKPQENELGTHIIIKGSKLEIQEPVSANNGTTFSVKNLFFNVPARRKFLKSNQTELKHIITEFQRIVLCHPEAEFALYHNDSLIYQLPKGNYHQRIANVFGKSININLIKIESDTTIVKISGFVGKPENAKKTYGEQYFFVNGRFMKHPYFNRAIMNAYENIIVPDTYPSYFIYLEVDPDTIDINIHPTKTEIKFENELAIWQFLHAASKQAIGKHNIAPSIDFNTDGIIDIPVPKRDVEFQAPEIKIDPNFNPFKTEQSGFKQANNQREINNLDNWEKLFPPSQNEFIETNTFESKIGKSNLSSEEKSDRFFQFKNTYILTPVKSGLMFVDQKRAHFRILHEQFLNSMESEKHCGQQSLFPQQIELSADNYAILEEIIEDIKLIGFDIRPFGKNTVVLQSYPADIDEKDPSVLIDEIIAEYQYTKGNVQKSHKEKVAQSLAKASTIPAGKSLTNVEMQELVDKLFACSEPSYTPTGKPTVFIMKLDEIEKKFN